MGRWRSGKKVIGHLRFTTGVSVFPSDPASLSQGKEPFASQNEAARLRVLHAATRACQHTHAVAHRASSTAVRQSYTGAAREGSERPSGRRAALALPAMRKLALLAALWMRGARVFVRQSSETPGALESCMRRSSGGLRDGVALAIVPMHCSDGGVWRVLPLGAHVLLVCRRSFRTRTRDSRGRLVIGTVGFCRLQ